MFDWLAEILKYVMIFCDRISFHQYALALFLFALLLKLLLFPLGIKTQKNQVKSAKLRPKEMAIRNKYKGRTDSATQQKMAAEIQEMYRAEGHSQFGGCLPMLIQLPILFSLYSIIQNPLYYLCRFGSAQIELITETFHRVTNYVSASAGRSLTSSIKVIGYLSEEGAIDSIINNLPVDGSVPAGAIDLAGNEITSFAAFRTDVIQRLTTTDFPNFKVFGFIDMAVTPNEQLLWYFLVPVFVFLAMFFTMRLQKKFTYQPAAPEGSGGLSMKLMDYAMPALSAFISLSLPTALGFYWIYQNVLGLGQQMILSKMYPLPKLSDAELKKLEREAEKAAAEAKKAELTEKKKKKSLHHEDDDDEPERSPEPLDEDDRKKPTPGGVEKAKLKDKDKK